MQNDLKKLEVPRPCELKDFPDKACPDLAEWAIDGVAICLEHLKAMAEMNSDNALFLVPVLKHDTPMTETIFIGVQAGFSLAGPLAWCISCAEEQFGDEVTAIIARTGVQGRLFTAIYIGSKEHDSRPCQGCKTPMNEGEENNA